MSEPLASEHFTLQESFVEFLELSGSGLAMLAKRIHQQTRTGWTIKSVLDTITQRDLTTDGPLLALALVASHSLWWQGHLVCR